MLKCTQLPANNLLRSGWGFTMPPNHSIHQHPPNRSCKMVRDMFNHISYQMSDDMLISTKHGINKKLHHITSAELKIKTHNTNSQHQNLSILQDQPFHLLHLKPSKNPMPPCHPYGIGALDPESDSNRPPSSSHWARSKVTCFSLNNPKCLKKLRGI